jgi:UDP-2,3-diacylglucosamine pyrophosphatase LpxH
MKKDRRDIIKLSGIVAAGLAMGGCGSSTASSTDGGLAVSLYPDQDRVAYDANIVTLKFNMPMDAQTLEGNITLADKNGTLEGLYDVMLDVEDVSSQTVILVLNGVSFTPSWRYRIGITSAVKSTTGAAFNKTQELAFVTTSRSPFEAPLSNTVRSKIVVISDLHLNQQRAADEGYGLFTENGALLTQFLDNVKNSTEIKELIILGDLMDMWVVPMAYDTIDTGTPDMLAYFQSVANAAVNKGITDKLNAIATEGLIQVTYVPGNHDMTLSESMFNAIFPDAVWKGGANGTSVYYPETGIACEHGHDYDAFNAPDTLTTAGSMLPPGYFITRIYATKNLTSPTALSSIQTQNTAKEYTVAFDLAVAAIDIPNLDLNKPQIVTGVDGYTQTYSVNGGKDIYTPTIETNWKQRQIDNGVYDPVYFETGLLNASGLFWFGTLEEPAIVQYFLQGRAKIVVFGHTHQAMIRKNLETLEQIYVNSGTWIDDKHVSSKALGRTCVVIDSAHSSGSEVDTVTVFQCQHDGTLKNVGDEYISV